MSLDHPSKGRFAVALTSRQYKALLSDPYKAPRSNHCKHRASHPSGLGVVVLKVCLKMGGGLTKRYVANLVTDASMCLACSTRLAVSYIDPTVTAAHAFLAGVDLTITNDDTDDMDELIAKLGFTTTDGGVNSIYVFTDPDGLSGTGSTRDYLHLNGLTDNMLKIG